MVLWFQAKAQNVLCKFEKTQKQKSDSLFSVPRNKDAPLSFPPIYQPYLFHRPSSIYKCLNPLAMASQLAPMAFSGQATGWSTSSNTKIWDHSFLPKKKCRFKSNNMKTPRRQMCMRAEVGKQTCTRAGSWKRRYTDHRLKVLSSSDIIPNPPSPFETIKQFYACINKKDLNQLGEFISDDCFFDDCSFYRPFQGKKVSFSSKHQSSIYPKKTHQSRCFSAYNSKVASMNHDRRLWNSLGNY